MKTFLSNVLHSVILILFLSLLGCSSDNDSNITIANSIDNISITPESPAILNIGDDINIEFDYSTADPDGARILVRPFTNGSITPGFVQSDSPLYSSGERTVNAQFNLLETTGNVDQIRFQMVNADQSTVLVEVFVNVDLTFLANSLDITSINPESPATLNTGDEIQIEFNYSTGEANGVRILAVPYSNGNISPGYVETESAIFPAGVRTVNESFPLLDAVGNVDQIRFQMLNADQSSVLLDFFVDVDLTFVANSIEVTSFSPESPATLNLGDRVEIEFNYSTDEVDGVLIFARPFTNGSLTPNYTASGSDTYPAGDGTLTVFFSVRDLPANVDQIRFLILSPDQSTVIYEIFIDVDYTFE